MQPSNEIVVIREAQAPSVSPAVSPVEPPEFSPDRQRDVDDAVSAIHGGLRQRILLSLAIVGPAPVTVLAERLGVERHPLSHHLGILRTMRILHDHRRGKQVWYECAPGRVRVERVGNRLLLTVTQSTGDTGAMCFAPCGEPGRTAAADAAPPDPAPAAPPDPAPACGEPRRTADPAKEPAS